MRPAWVVPLFLSTPSARRATALGIEISRNVHISIHALREEGDALRHVAVGCCGISIHALREEGDPRETPVISISTPFLSTPSARRATWFLSIMLKWSAVFLSTPSARRATRPSKARAEAIRISIHALREEGDMPWALRSRAMSTFLSTPSARRATRGQCPYRYKR